MPGLNPGIFHVILRIQSRLFGMEERFADMPKFA
jgi:hypothetical protein